MQIFLETFFNNPSYIKVQSFIENSLEKSYTLRHIDDFVCKKLNKGMKIKDILKNLSSVDSDFKRNTLKYIVDFDRIDFKVAGNLKDLKTLKIPFLKAVEKIFEKQVPKGLDSNLDCNEYERATLISIYIKFAHKTQFEEGLEFLLKKSPNLTKIKIRINDGNVIKSRPYIYHLARQGLHKFFDEDFIKKMDLLEQDENSKIGNVDIGKVFRHCLKGYNENPDKKDATQELNLFSPDYKKLISTIVKNKYFYKNVIENQNSMPMYDAIKYDIEEAVFQLIKQYGLAPFISEINRDYLKAYLDETIKESHKDSQTSISVNYEFLMPKKISPKVEIGSTSTNETSITIENDYEDPLKQITEHSDLKDLIKHPVLYSYIIGMSNQVKNIYKINLVVYIFLILFVGGTYYLSYFSAHQFSLIFSGLILLIREFSQIYLTKSNKAHAEGTTNSNKCLKLLRKIDVKIMLIFAVHALIVLIIYIYFDSLDKKRDSKVFYMISAFLFLFHFIVHYFKNESREKVLWFLMPTFLLLVFILGFTNLTESEKIYCLLIPLQIISTIPVTKTDYVSQSNFVEMTLIAYLGYTALLIDLENPNLDGEDYNKCFAVTVLLLALELIILLSEVFAEFCVYMLMLKKVASTFCKLIVIILLFVIAFAMSFKAITAGANSNESKSFFKSYEISRKLTNFCCILKEIADFNDTSNKNETDSNTDLHSFKDIWTSFIKVLIMLTGEYGKKYFSSLPQ